MRWCWSGWPSAPTRTDSNSTWTTWTILSMRLQCRFFLRLNDMKESVFVWWSAMHVRSFFLLFFLCAGAKQEEEIQADSQERGFQQNQRHSHNTRLVSTLTDSIRFFTSFHLRTTATAKSLFDSILDVNHFRIKAEEEEEDLLDAYATPGKVSHKSDFIKGGTTAPAFIVDLTDLLELTVCGLCALLCSQGSQKRALTTPEHPQSKRSAALLASPGLLLSPASFSPRYLLQNTSR